MAHIIKLSDDALTLINKGLQKCQLRKAIPVINDINAQIAAAQQKKQKKVAAVETTKAIAKVK
jgi:hypothetical protein